MKTQECTMPGATMPSQSVKAKLVKYVATLQTACKKKLFKTNILNFIMGRDFLIFRIILLPLKKESSLNEKETVFLIHLIIRMMRIDYCSPITMTV